MARMLTEGEREREGGRWVETPRKKNMKERGRRGKKSWGHVRKIILTCNLVTRSAS